MHDARARLDRPGWHYPDHDRRYRRSRSHTHEPTSRKPQFGRSYHRDRPLLAASSTGRVGDRSTVREYLGGYITEKALASTTCSSSSSSSRASACPTRISRKSLLAGIVVALILRLIFILTWAQPPHRKLLVVFYIFRPGCCGPPSIQVREGVGEDEEEDEYRPPSIVRWVSKIVPVTDGFVSSCMLYRHGGRIPHLPMFLCVIAVGTARSCDAVDDPRDLLAHNEGVPGVCRQRVLLARGCVSSTSCIRWSPTHVSALRTAKPHPAG